MATLTDVTAFIVSEADHDALDRIGDAIRQRHQALKEITAAAVRKGADVRIEGIKPKYLVGLTGTVEAIQSTGRQRVADVRLDEDSTDRLRWEPKSKIVIPEGTKRYLLTGIPLPCCRQA